MLNIGRVQVSRPNELCVSCPFLWRKEHQLSCPLQGCNGHSVEAKSVAPSGAMKTKWILFYEENKNPIKMDGQNYHRKDQKEGQRKAKWHVGPQEPKKGEI